MKIIILSSDFIIREFFYDVCKKHGCEVRTYKCLEGKEKKIFEEKPNLILVDFQLFITRKDEIPAEDGGIEAIKKIEDLGKIIPTIFFHTDEVKNKFFVNYRERIKNLKSKPVDNSNLYEKYSALKIADTDQRIQRLCEQQPAAINHTVP